MKLPQPAVVERSSAPVLYIRARSTQILPPQNTGSVTRGEYPDRVLTNDGLNRGLVGWQAAAVQPPAALRPVGMVRDRATSGQAAPPYRRLAVVRLPAQDQEHRCPMRPEQVHMQARARSLVVDP